MTQSLQTRIASIAALIPHVKACKAAKIRYVHRFTDGMYIRQATAPAGTFIVGAVHLTTHPFVLLSGSMQLLHENGTAERLQGPLFGITIPGQIRMLLMETETVFITFHATKETNVKKIVNQITFKPSLKGKQLCQF